MGAFKFRGAFNALSRFDARAARGRRGRLLVGQPCAGDRAVGAPARHAGDHRHAARRAGGQGRGDARLRRATVVLYDRYREDREAIGRQLADERGLTLIPPYDHPRRHRRPGHGRQGADRGGRRRSTRCSSASAAAACSPARRSRRARSRRLQGLRRRARGRQRRPAVVSRSGSDRPHRHAEDDRRRRADPVARRASPSRSSGATSTTSSP